MKLVVRILESVPGDDGVSPIWVHLDQFDLAYPNASTLYPLASVPENVLEEFGAGTGTAVQELGGTLLGSLTTHPAVHSALDSALGSPAPCPVYLRLESPQAAQYAWESLFHAEKDRFLALETQWPIARITEFAPADKDVRYFAPPLRILAVLSAVGIDAGDEWQQLYARVREAADQHGADVLLHVVAGTQDLVSTIEAEAAGDARVSASLLESRQFLLEQIASIDPHILHFYCHGTGSPTPNLELGTNRDHVTGVSSVYIEPSELRLAGLATWLVVLNCCEGGKSDAGVDSLAHQLISAGYPAAVGMREPIDAGDATRFTSAFYRSLLERFAEDLEPGEEAAVEWVAALPGPRRALLEQFAVPTREAAASHRNWTFPVLYVRPEPLRVRTVEIHPDHNEPTRQYLLAQLNLLSKAQLALDENTSPGAIAEIRDKLDEVAARLAAPKVDG